VVSTGNDAKPLLSAAELLEAQERVRPHVHRTPVISSRYFSELSGAEIFFKCENFQRIGAFKIRGALNAILSLPEERLIRGVVTHSSGNHAQAVALAARIRGAQAQIVMPRGASPIKMEAVRGYGGTIHLCEPTGEAREAAASELLERTGGEIIHPFNDPRIVAGQATAAMELIEEISGLDLILAPVGGGGLLSGTALAARHFSPSTRIIGCEPAAADDAYRSLEAGRIIPSIAPDTVADGLRTSLGEITFGVIRQLVERIVTVKEQAIVEAMRRVWERMKIVIEPSAAVAVAALLEFGPDLEGRRVGVILSGGNVDLGRLPWQRSAGSSAG
jgi:threonine dehydratase